MRAAGGVFVAFDTATEAIGLGVARVSDAGRETLHSAALPSPRKANTLLLETLVQALAETGCGLPEVGAVIVGRGPGSFTGVRIGVAAAKGLAQGLGVPLYGVSTAEAIAWEASARGHEGLLGVVGDAMRGEVYPVLFRCSGHAVRRLSPDRVAAPADVAAEWAGDIDEPLLMTGNGLAKYREVFGAALTDRASFASEEWWYPTGEGLFAAAERASGDGELGSGDPGGVLPVYTRLSDAEENERARAGASPRSEGPS